MNSITLAEKSVRQATAANAVMALAAVLGLWAAPVQAAPAQSSGAFAVTINLQGNGTATGGGTATTPAAALCRSGTMVGTFGSSVTVVCSTGAVVSSAGTGASNLPWTATPDNTYRFMLNAYREGDDYRAVDYFPPGTGTDATWRTIRLNDRDYLEMMLHW